MIHNRCCCKASTCCYRQLHLMLWFALMHPTTKQCNLSTSSTCTALLYHIISLSILAMVMKARAIWCRWFICSMNTNSSLVRCKCCGLSLQVTTHSRVLSRSEILEMTATLPVQTEVIFLHQFDAEIDFSNKIRYWKRLWICNTFVLIYTCIQL